MSFQNIFLIFQASWLKFLKIGERLMNKSSKLFCLVRQSWLICTLDYDLFIFYYYFLFFAVNILRFLVIMVDWLARKLIDEDIYYVNNSYSKILIAMRRLPLKLLDAVQCNFITSHFASHFIEIFFHRPRLLISRIFLLNDSRVVPPRHLKGTEIVVIKALFLPEGVRTCSIRDQHW